MWYELDAQGYHKLKNKTQSKYTSADFTYNDKMINFDHLNWKPQSAFNGPEIDYKTSLVQVVL